MCYYYGRSDYSVNITTTQEDAAFKIFNTHGELVHKGTTPSYVHLKSDAGPFAGETYKIEFAKDGYKPKVIILDSTISPAYFLNLLWGGLLGLLIIDPISGDMFNLPEKISTTLDKTDDVSLHIRSIDSLSEEEKSRLVPINN